MASEDNEPDRLQKGLALTFCFLQASFVFVSSGCVHNAESRNLQSRKVQINDRRKDATKSSV